MDDLPGATHGADDVDPQFGSGRRLKSTTSLCPSCLERIPAVVFERTGRVFMDKTCAEHGQFTALLASDARHYYLADPAVEALGSCCGPGQHCGDQVANHSCNMLIEITQRCNLTCPTCYANSSPERDETMSFEAFEKLLDSLLEQGKGGADLIQLSGGEPTIHPRVFDMIELALEKGIRQVYVNTNGIKLASESFAQRLANFGSAVSVYLQFDGFRQRTLQLLRGADDLLRKKLRALDHCERLGINVVPVMTLTAGINDDELGGFLEMAQEKRCIQKVMIQPAMYSGRYENPRRVERMTVADVVDAIAKQTDGLFGHEDFTPIPCSDPNCFSMGLALRTTEGLMPISRYFPAYGRWSEDGTKQIIAQVTDTFDSATELEAMIEWVFSSGALAALDEGQLDELLDRISAWQASRQGEEAGGYQGLFAIGIKPFMDAYTFDQDRIDKCCVHIIATDGTPVSFCEYNAINRPLGRG